jgi:hypothetical protein
MSFLTLCSVEGTFLFLFHTHTVHLNIIKVFYSPTDAQVNYLKSNFKIYIKTAPTCFDSITIIREVLFELAKVTVVKKGKGKPFPLQAWTGSKGSRRLMLPDFKTIGT